jgi:multicomponent Na+:H+ antiporter subunit G
MQIAIDACLAFAVATVWLGAAGFVRLPTPLDRIHAVTFINAAAGAAITLAAFLADGPTDRACKVLFIWLFTLAAGAALSHITGRALTHRQPGQ